MRVVNEVDERERKNRIARIRRKKRRGESLTIEEKTYLDAWLQTKQKRGRPSAEERALEGDIGASQAANEPVAEPFVTATYTTEQRDTVSSRAPAVETAPLPVWTPSPREHTIVHEHRDVPAPPAPKCPVGADCPGCNGAGGGITCTTSGRTIYPKMRKTSARLWAKTIFAFIKLGVEFLEGEEVPKPMKEEVDDFADAIADLVYRRFSVLGSFDDITATAGCATEFAISRDLYARTVKKKRRARASVANVPVVPASPTKEAA